MKASQTPAYQPLRQANRERNSTEHLWGLGILSLVNVNWKMA